MRATPWLSVEHYRWRRPHPDWMSDYGDPFGIFQIPSLARGEPMRVIVSTSDGWDHVSVSLQRRCPTWEELEYVKRLFWAPEETAMQLHVPVADHINHNPHCLHLWRPQDQEIPRPPSWMVGPVND